MDTIEIEKIAKSRITIEKLLELVDPKNPALLKELGGASGLAEKLHSNIEKGLSNDIQILEEQKKIYGDNKLPEPITHTLWEFVWEALKDKTLIVLMGAAAFEGGIGIYKILSKNDNLALIDGAAIIGAGKKFAMFWPYIHLSSYSCCDSRGRLRLQKTSPVS